jgi:hypothetical protein
MAGQGEPGDTVEAGDTLVVIESMKMEIPVITEDAGTVKEILVKEKIPSPRDRSSPFSKSEGFSRECAALLIG